MARWVASAAVLLFAGLVGLGQACPTVAVVIPETVIIELRCAPEAEPPGRLTADLRV